MTTSMFLANFRQGLLNCCGVITNLIFLIWRYPPFWICYTHARDHPRRPLGIFITVQNLVEIGSVVLIISKFNYFSYLAENCLFTPILERFLGISTHKWGASLTGPPKGISLQHSGTTVPGCDLPPLDELCFRNAAFIKSCPESDNCFCCCSLYCLLWMYELSHRSKCFLLLLSFIVIININVKNLFDLLLSIRVMTDDLH